MVRTAQLNQHARAPGVVITILASAVEARPGGMHSGAPLRFQIARVRVPVRDRQPWHSGSVAPRQHHAQDGVTMVAATECISAVEVRHAHERAISM